MKYLIAILTLLAGPLFAGPIVGPPEPTDYAKFSLVEINEIANPFDGFYVGVSAKYAFGANTFEYAVGKKDNELWSADLSGAGWGVYAGYGQVLGNGLYFGVEGQYQQFGTETTMLVHNGCRRFTAGLDSIVNARARVGFQTGKALLYVHGGYSWGQVSTDLRNVNAATDTTINTTVSGFAYGAGVEYALGQNVKLRLEYTVNDLASVEFSAFGRDHSMGFASQEVLAGISWTF